MRFLYRFAAAGFLFLTTHSAVVSAETYWEHNGSIVYLVSNASTREFYYHQPRPGMLDAGARRGTLLFRGISTRGRYIGTAYIFRKGCGSFPYEVAGPITDGFERVELHGKAPRIGADCRVLGYFSDTLEFILLQGTSAPARTGQQTGSLRRFQGTWTDTDGICRANMESGGATVYTIEGNEITYWFYYSSPPQKDHAYGSCGAENRRFLADGDLLVDLDCDHPGHSTKNVTFGSVNQDTIRTPFGILHRCR
jgi:hypothetical protein